MNIKYKIINHHSPNHTSEVHVCWFGFQVLLFFVYTSCSAVVPVNLVLLFPRLTLHPQGWGGFHLTCLWSAINCRYWDSPRRQRLLLAPHGTASLLRLLVLLVSSGICLERPVTNEFLFLVSSSASLSDSLDLSPHSLATCTGPLCVKINFHTQPLPHLGSRYTPP